MSLPTLEPATTVRASHGLRIEPEGVLSDPDLLVVPGGGWNDHAESGARAEAEDGALPAAIADRHAHGTTVAAICTGGMLVSRAGLLANRPAVTHRGALAELRATDARVVDARVVDAGNVLTAGGVTAGLDLALYLLEREVDEELAKAVAAGMEYERRGPIHRDGDAG